MDSAYSLNYLFPMYFYVLFAVLSIGWGELAHADEFHDVLQDLQVEANAQHLYFKSVVEEHLTERGSHEIVQTSKSNVLVHVDRATLHAGEASQIQVFWLIFRDYLAALDRAYLAVGEPYQAEWVQESLSEILEQVNRDALLNFVSIKTSMGTILALDKTPISHPHLKTKYIDRPSVSVLSRPANSPLAVERDRLFEIVLRLAGSAPHRNFHLTVDLSRLSFLLRETVPDSPAYRTFLPAFKATVSILKKLQPFSIRGIPPVPVEITPMPQVPYWTDRVLNACIKASVTQARSARNIELIFENFILSPEFADPIVAEIITAVQSRLDRYTSKATLAVQPPALTEIKKTKSVRKKVQEPLTAPSYAPEVSEVPELSAVPVALPVPVEPIQHTLPIKDDDYDLETYDYRAYLNETRKSADEDSQENHAQQASAVPENGKIHLTGGAANIYRTAMGLGAFQTGNADLKDFVKQVGGAFVKVSGPHSDPKIALPNFNPEATQPFYVDKMHLLHSGRETFRLGTLRAMLGRMIRAAHLDRRIELD